MELKLVGLRERFAAHVANTWLFLGMRSADMAVMGCMGSERLTTMLTLQKRNKHIIQLMIRSFNCNICYTWCFLGLRLADNASCEANALPQCLHYKRKKHIVQLMIQSFNCYTF